MDSLLRDLRYALASLGRNRVFALLAVLCLGLGIGVNTAVFSMVNMLLFRPLPFEEPDRVLRIYAAQSRAGWELQAFSAAELADLQAGTTTLLEVAGAGVGGFNLLADGEPVRASGSPVTANLFPLLGVEPQLGRNFLPEENQPGAERVVILSEELWRQQFGGAADVIGRTVSLNGAPTTVVGVMPPRFGFPERAELWIPALLDPAAPRDQRRYMGVARLHADANLAQANAELTRISRQLAAEYPEASGELTFGLRRFQDAYIDSDRTGMLYLLLAAVGLVLLIACGNVANLLLARGTARQRELAVRAALGAGRARIIRQLLTESLLLALAGGALGVLVAQLWLRWILSRVEVELVYWMSFELDWRVLVYTAVLSLLTGLIFGTLPALRASRVDLRGALNDSARGWTVGVRGSRLRRALVVGEIALSLVLLIAATLVIRSFLAAVATDPGIETERVLTMRTSLTGERYDGAAVRAETFRELAERIRALPGVEGAAFTTALPAGDLGMGVRVHLPGEEAAEGEGLMVRSVAITPEYWQTMRQPLLAGRTFTTQEAADSASRVVIVSEELAARLWPEESALGQRLRRANDDPDGWFTVVGVAPSLPYATPGATGAEWERQIHLPYAVEGWRLMTLAVRTTGDPASLTPLVRREVQAVDPTLPLFSVWTLDQYRASTLWDRRAFGEVFGSFALLALILAMLGVYGVVAYTAGQRTREIGIRRALGAGEATVARMILHEGALLAGIGIIVGLLGALAITPVLRSVLQGVAPVDPWAFVGIPLLLAAVAILASYFPARRAARVDPATALRAE